MEEYTFAGSSSLDFPVNVKMFVNLRYAMMFPLMYWPVEALRDLKPHCQDHSYSNDPVYDILAPTSGQQRFHPTPRP